MKASEFDKAIKDQVKKVGHIAPANVTWDINKSWNKLSELLKQASPKTLVWYFSLAASVSMLMANATLINNEWEDILPASSMSLVSNASSPITSVPTQPTVELTTIRPSRFPFVDAKAVKSLPTIKSIQNRAEFVKMEQPASELTSKNEKVAIRPNFHTGISASGLRLSAELMVIANKKIHNSSLGMSLEMNSQHFNSLNQETIFSSRSQQALYINMVVLGGKAKRPWSARIGTPLWQTNPTDSTAPMIKMNYQTKVGQRVYIGPEVIVSKGFRQVYPGICISFG